MLQPPHRDVIAAAKPRKSCKRNRDISKNLDIVERVAQLSYFHGGRRSNRSAHDVAAEMVELGYKDTTVHSVLACRDAAFEGDDPLLTIHFHWRHERAEVLRLEPMLQRKFNLRKVLLVPGYPEMLKALPREDLQSIHAEVRLKLVQKAAAYVTQVLAAAAAARRAEYRLGIAWGHTMALVGRAIRSAEPGPRPSTVTVHPIVGITEPNQYLPVQANVIASQVAGVFRAASGQVPCPAIVSYEAYDAIVNLRQVRAALDEIANLDLVLTAMGPIEDAGDARDITLSTDPEENAMLFRTARAAGACGEICCWWFDRLGNPVQTPYRSVGLGLEGLKRIARDEEGTGRQVVLLAGGDRRRLAPLLAALKGGYASVLVTDTVTAWVLLGEKEVKG